MKQYVNFYDITRKALCHCLKEQGIKIDDTVVDQLMQRYDSLSVFNDVVPALEILSAFPDVEKVIFSNGTPAMITNSVEGSDALKSRAFSQTISVDYVRSFKPAPETYRYLVHCLKKSGQEKDIWLVSSNPFDVVGGRAAGLNAVWVDRDRKGWRDQLGEGPTTIISSLKEIGVVIEEHTKNKFSKI